MIKLAVSGCQGRMGQRIAALAHVDPDFQLKTLLEHKDHPQSKAILYNIPILSDPEAIQGCDVLIEFTTPAATLEHLQVCWEYKVKMVIGTTGLREDQIKDIQKAAKTIPIVMATNMSIGVNILFKLVEVLSRAVPPLYKVKIIEAHHVHKKDAPSGTAKTLAQIIQEHSAHKVSDIQSIREGEIIGDHKVIFESPLDTIEIFHSAKTRDIFANGALTAAKFLVKKKKGLFHMLDVLELR